MTNEEKARHDAAFLRKFGLKPNDVGEIPVATRCNVAKCAVLRKYGAKLNGELLADMILDAQIECLQTATDATRPAYSQLKYLDGAALKAAKRTLRENGYSGGRVLKQVNASALEKDDNPWVLDSQPDPRSGDATKQYDEREEMTAILATLSKYALKEAERQIIHGLLEGLSMAEVGRRLGVTRARVRQRIADVRQIILDDNPQCMQDLIQRWKRNHSTGAV